METINEVLWRIGLLESKPAPSDDTAGEQKIWSQLPCKSLDELRKFGAALDGSPEERTSLVRVF